ncbi:MAG: hypothetical protein QF752_09405 [Planctomycetota bacterium]|jgi:hypothetical protein|nr:hypothetical protein [Planctomycetota bacterium]
MRPLLLLFLAFFVWTPLASADRHASCSECGKIYVLSRKGVGFARDHRGACANCRTKIEVDVTKLPTSLPTPWDLLLAFADALTGTDNRFGDHDHDGIFNVHDTDYEGVLWSAGAVTVRRQ